MERKYRLSNLGEIGQTRTKNWFDILMALPVISLIPILSEIEIRMVLTDMDGQHYNYNGKNKDSHNELRNRLNSYLK